MERILTDRLKNYIIFSYIKEFVSDLTSVYEDDDALSAYKHFIDEANILTETEDFVKGFKYALNGKHKARYCDGSYINIPRILAKDDQNREIIENDLKKLSKIYNNIEEECKELVFLKKYTKAISKKIPESIDSEPHTDSENYIKEILNTIKPGVEKSQQAFKDKNLNIEKFLKIILVSAYDQIETLGVFHEDSKHIKNIINTVANTPLTQLATKKLELIKEFMMIENLKDFPFKNVMGNINVI